MIKNLKKVLALTLTFIMIFGCVASMSYAMTETSMAAVLDTSAIESKSEYLGIPFASEMYDKVASDKEIAVYHSEERTYITERDEFEYALTNGKIEYVTSINSEKAEIRVNDYNIYGYSFNGFRLYWENENLSDEGYYLICIESGTLVSDDGAYCNAEVFVPDVKGPSTNFLTQLIDNIKAFFQSIIDWFKNLFSF